MASAEEVVISKSLERRRELPNHAKIPYLYDPTALSEENLGETIEETITKNVSEEELEGVARGTDDETLKDVKFLHSIGGLPEFATAEELKADRENVERTVRGVFEDYGITVNISATGENIYRESKHGAPPITRAQAYAIFADKFGNPDFNYKKYL